MSTNMGISPEAMIRYRHAAQARDLARKEENGQRRQAAWIIAREAARLLKDVFGASRVIAYGSLAHGAWFGPRSDIDLAAEGVPVAAFWRAWAALDRIAPSFEIDLVAFESVSGRLRAEIVEYGVTL